MLILKEISLMCDIRFRRNLALRCKGNKARVERKRQKNGDRRREVERKENVHVVYTEYNSCFSLYTFIYLVWKKLR